MTRILVALTLCLWVLLALSGCGEARLGVFASAHAPEPAAPAPPPLPRLVCPGPVPVPVAPKPPRDVDSIARYAIRLDEALVRSEAARRACNQSLDALRAWARGIAP